MVNGDQEGLIYHSEVFDDEPLTPGALLEAWVLKVRDDGKVDVSLRQPAVQQVALRVLPALLPCAPSLLPVL
jgi:predicted RNA-binding protein (virulence factor B family)